MSRGCRGEGESGVFEPSKCRAETQGKNPALYGHQVLMSLLTTKGGRVLRAACLR